MSRSVGPRYLPLIRGFFLVSVVAIATGPWLRGEEPINGTPWISDQGDGTYKNPVLFADYSDPDAIRVGQDFYLVSSSFDSTPGLPILRSQDLVNWTIINHALRKQVPLDHYSKVQHGGGVWAPSIRYHDGQFWIYYPDPDYGIYVTKAKDVAGIWSTPELVLAGKGLIDPCPLWDDDGQLYLVHAWAKSRSGISNRLTLHRLSRDGQKVLDQGTIIVDGDKIPGWSVLEGPKLYKRNAYYYIFAPSGGVTNGYQAVFRAKSIYGPYDHRVVLDQGQTPINGPHQGAWVDTPTGEDWFLHFQDRGVFGRVVHLEPMIWTDDWPVIGEDPHQSGKGQPVLTHVKPNVAKVCPMDTPQTFDEFDQPQLGPQWQWNANPQDNWASLKSHPGFLRLPCLPHPNTPATGTSIGQNIYDLPNLLLQKFPAPTFVVTTGLELVAAGVGETSGLIVFGYDYAALALRKTATGFRLVYLVNLKANRPGSVEREAAGVDLKTCSVYLRVTVASDAKCQFAYSLDNRTFTPIGSPFQAVVDRWIGAKFGLFAVAPPSTSPTGYGEFDWFHVQAVDSAMR